MSTNDPEQIRQDIETTRRNLAYDVNELGETISPGNVAQRQKDKLSERATALKDKVMGSASDMQHSAEDLRDSGTEGVQHAVDQASTMVQDAPAKARQKTKGNPLAVGLIALGAGWLVGSLLPASEKEQEAAQAMKEKAEPLLEAGREEAKQIGQDVADHLKEPASDAAEEVKSVAQESAENVKAEGQSAADKVKDSGQQAKDDVTASTQQAKDNVQEQR